MLSEIDRNIVSLRLGKIADSAHPCAETPQRRHLWLAHHICIFIEDILRLTEEDEEIHCLIFHEEFHRLRMRLTEITGHRCRGMHKDTVSPVTHKERYRLVHIRGLRTLRVCHEQIQFLSHLIHSCR